MTAIDAARHTYHHGDLRQALLEAGLELAAASGPDAVVLREATRRVGVSPNAAYRHFADRDALLEAVSDAAMARMAGSIDEIFDAIPPGDPREVACAQLRAVGTGYVAFAVDHPGLFRTAFFVPADMERAATAEKAGRSGRTPFELLTVAIDGLVASGTMPESRRPNAEFLAWSAVHGLAMLHLEGPLAHLGSPMLEGVRDRVVEMAVRGI